MYLRGIADQWIGVWRSLSVRQKISLGLAAVLVAGGLLGFAWWREQDFKPLFTNMGAEDAGAVVDKLKETATEFRVSDGGSTVLVRTAKVAEVRLALAGAGLPKTGRIGFELFDKANLGTTDFAEQVNYRRALEGELERTIKSVTEVEQARVHLTFPKDSVFLESRLPAKASVLLRIKPRVQLTPQNVAAITHLVASAVEGLDPDAVSVMDVRGNLLSRPKRAQGIEQASDEVIEYRQRLEKDLLEKVNATLQPLLGAGRFRAGVSVECDLTSGEQSEESYDPEKSVMLNSTKTEETNSGPNSGGVPGTGSNLPRSSSRASSNPSSVTRRSETIAYQTSRTVKRLSLPRGGVKRVSATVLMDQAVRWEGPPGRMQRVLVPPAPESLRAIRELVSAAIGFTPSRGDQLVIETLPFESTLQEAPPAPAEKPVVEKTPSPWSIEALVQGRFEAAILLSLLIAAGYVFLSYRKRKLVKRVDVTGAIGTTNTRSAIGEQTSDALPGRDGGARLLGNAADGATGSEGSRIDTLVESLRGSITDDAALAASVLRTWLDEKHGGN